MKKLRKTWIADIKITEGLIQFIINRVFVDKYEQPFLMRFRILYDSETLEFYHDRHGVGNDGLCKEKVYAPQKLCACECIAKEWLDEQKNNSSKKE